MPRGILRAAEPLAVSFACFLLSLEALADEPARCQVARARAASDAALLMAPQLTLQGIRFPSRSHLDIGPTVGTGYQLRLGVMFSPLDVYRGWRTVRAGELACAAHEAAIPLQEVLGKGADTARLRALKQQALYLNQRREQWLALVARAEERLNARTLSLGEFDELRRRVYALERKRLQVEGESRRIEARAVPPGPTAPAELARQLEERAHLAEQETAGLRTLDGWQLRMTGGVIPQRPVDWYAMAELSFSLGAPIRHQQEARYLQGRAAELHEAPYELIEQWRRLQGELVATLDQARRDLAVVEQEIATIDRTRRALETSETPRVAHARDLIAVEQLSAESDQVFLRQQIEALNAVIEAGHGS